MPILRQHNTLADVLQKELTGVPNPRQAAAAILQKTQGAESLVLFKDKTGGWIVLPVGPTYELRNVGQAARARAGGKDPVAFCRLQR